VANDAGTITVHECGETAPRVSAGNWQVDFVAAIESAHLDAAPRILPTHPMPQVLTEAAGERLAEMKKVLRATVAGVRAH
jgi:hypothetical protein